VLGSEALRIARATQKRKQACSTLRRVPQAVSLLRSSLCLQKDSIALTIAPTIFSSSLVLFLVQL
jgi:hypothetical protein